MKSRVPRVDDFALESYLLAVKKSRLFQNLCDRGVRHAGRCMRGPAGACHLFCPFFNGRSDRWGSRLGAGKGKRPYAGGKQHAKESSFSHIQNHTTGERGSLLKNYEDGFVRHPRSHSFPSFLRSLFNLREFLWRCAASMTPCVNTRSISRALRLNSIWIRIRVRRS